LSRPTFGYELGGIGKLNNTLIAFLFIGVTVLTYKKSHLAWLEWL